LETLRLYKICKKTYNRKKLKRIYAKLAQADILTKSAYNNIALSDETKKIAEAIQHYRQFEVVTAYESLDMVNTQLRRHATRIETIFKYIGTTTEKFKKDFDEMYYDFFNNPKR
jgi:hypothetical protein